MKLYSVGHSSRSFEEFAKLLSDNQITLLVDVRSKPFSRFCPQYNRSFLETHLPMQYVWIPALGGLDKTIPIDDFEEAIEDVIRYSKRFSVCLMCSEKDPAKCHRTTKIAPALEARGNTIIHIGT